MTELRFLLARRLRCHQIASLSPKHERHFTQSYSLGARSRLRSHSSIQTVQLATPIWKRTKRSFHSGTLRHLTSDAMNFFQMSFQVRLMLPNEFASLQPRSAVEPPIYKRRKFVSCSNFCPVLLEGLDQARLHRPLHGALNLCLNFPRFRLCKLLQELLYS